MAPVSNYGGRNGMSTALRLVREICRIYTKFSGGIVAFITASALTAPQKTLVLDWLNGASAVCAILESSILVSYER